MVVEVYNGSTFNKKTVLNQVISYHYKEHLYNIGEFELVVADSDPGDLWVVVPGDILYIHDDENNDDSLCVSTITYEKGRITYSGHDLKIILNWRITLFPTEELEAGTYGYDCRAGCTGDIIKGYIDYNLCEADDISRRLSSSFCTADSGNTGDSYMSRLQPLNEVVEELCSNSGMGYRVFFDKSARQIGINVFELSDRRGFLGFGTYIGNAEKVSRTCSNSSERTIAWAVNGTDVSSSTVTAVKLTDGMESGLERKETVATANCDIGLVEMCVKKAMKDCISTEEIDAVVSENGSDYNYQIGDIVKVFDDRDCARDMVIIATEKDYSGCRTRMKLSFADYQAPVSRSKTLTKLVTENSTAKKDIIDQKLDSGSGESENNGLTINNAVIIQEADAKYLLHEYTQIEYIAGNQIVFAGATNPVIVQGYVLPKYVYSGDNASNIHVYIKDDEDGSIYAEKMSRFTFFSRIELNNAYFKYKSCNITELRLTFVSWDETYTTYNLEYVKDDGTAETLYKIETRNAAGAPSGITLFYNEIIAPNVTKSGYSSETGFVVAYYGYKIAPSTNGLYYYRSLTAKTEEIYIPFASLAEYNAAVGLTYEPISLTQVNETTTVVSERG